MNGFGWTPVIEPKHTAAFVTQYQYEAIANGQMAKVPLMIGMASEEMLFRGDCKKILYEIPLGQVYIILFCYSATLGTRAAMLDNDPTALISKNMHASQAAAAGKAAQAIYGSFKANPYKAVKVCIAFCCYLWYIYLIFFSSIQILLLQDHLSLMLNFNRNTATSIFTNSHIMEIWEEIKFMYQVKRCFLYRVIN